MVAAIKVVIFHPVVKTVALEAAVAGAKAVAKHLAKQRGL